MSFRRSDQLLSSGSAGPDDDTLFELHESCSDESRYGSGSTDWNPSTGDVSLTTTVFGLGGDSKLKSGESSLSEISMTPQYHSESSGHSRNCRMSSEAADTVAGIPSVRSDSSSLGIAGLYSDTQSCVRMQHNVDGIVLCHGSIPHQVEDDDEQCNWNPVKDVMHRIRLKIKFLTKSESLPESDLNLLLTAEGIH